MFKAIKKWWINYKHKKAVASSEVYMVVYRDDRRPEYFNIKSIHKTLEGAKSHHLILVERESIIKEHYHIERYGLWE